MKGILLHVGRFTNHRKSAWKNGGEAVEKESHNILGHKETVTSANRRENLWFLPRISAEPPEDIIRSTPYSYQYIL